MRIQRIYSCSFLCWCLPHIPSFRSRAYLHKSTVPSNIPLVLQNCHYSHSYQYIKAIQQSSYYGPRLCKAIFDIGTVITSFEVGER